MTTPPPARSARFAFPGWRVEGGDLVFAFDCDRFGAFEERVWWPGTPFPDAPDEGLARLVTLLHVALGVSAYKAGAATQIGFPALTPAGQATARRLYTDGLAEFLVRAGLPCPPRTEIAFAGTLDPAPEAPQGHTGPAIVAFGGGKDSYVARAIVEDAGIEARLGAVVMSGAVGDAIAATAPEDAPVRFARRALDPRLRGLDGALNGHVPITAINMLVLAIEARLTGAGAVVFANERSADEPTLTLPDGTPANHQDSKSGAFEALMAGALAEADGRAPALFSVLRPYSEVWIARAFSRLVGAHPRFTSCNRNFRLAGDATARWCGECAKCAFTGLLLSPWLTRGQHLVAFDGDMLARDSLLGSWEALLGLTGAKPWDCVGTVDECRATLWRLSRAGDWTDSLPVRALLPRVLERTTPQALEAAWEAALTPAGEDRLPRPYRDAAARV